MPDRVHLDGAQGEGGGQILRTALSLALCTGKPFELVNARAARPNPGLRPQHVACVLAAREISGGRVEGAEVGSSRVLFEPGSLRAGEWTFDVGTAGSVALLGQALALPLALAGEPSTLRLRGGTHGAHAPTFHYLSLVWAPMVARLGFVVRAEMIAAGFYPQGGGEVVLRVEPCVASAPLVLLHRGTLREVSVLSMVGGLPYAIAERQGRRAVQRLREAGIAAQPEVAPLIAPRSKGSCVMCLGEFEHSRAATTALGEKGKPAEKVADEAARAFVELMAGRGATDPHLADQLLVPAALVAAGVPCREGPPVSRYTTARVTRHLTTNAEVVARFLDVAIDVKGALGEEGEVLVLPRPVQSA